MSTEWHSRPWPTAGPWENTLTSRGFDCPTGRALPLGVRVVAAGVVIVVAFALWGIGAILRHPDIGIGS